MIAVRGKKCDENRVARGEQLSSSRLQKAQPAHNHPSIQLSASPTITPPCNCRPFLLCAPKKARGRYDCDWWTGGVSALCFFAFSTEIFGQSDSNLHAAQEIKASCSNKEMPGLVLLLATLRCISILIYSSHFMYMTGRRHCLYDLRCYSKYYPIVFDESRSVNVGVKDDKLLH